MQSFKAAIVALLIIPTAYAQAPEQHFRQIAQWATQNNAQKIIEWHQHHGAPTITGDSLAWYHYYVSQSYLQTGDYTKADSVLQPYYTNLKGIDDSDLQIRVMMNYALLEKKRNRYHSSIQSYNKIIPLVKSRIEQYRMSGEEQKMQYEIEKLTAIKINISTNNYYLGNIDSYGTYTRKALNLARQNGIRRQELLARRNLIEYFEITEQWDSAAVHLNTYAQIIKSQKSVESVQSVIEYTRYKIREATYLKSHLDKLEKAEQILEQALNAADSLMAYQVYEDALYQLLHVYILQKKWIDANNLLNTEVQNPMVQRNPNALGIIQARKLQFYIITGYEQKAKETYKALQVIDKTGVNTETEALITHAIVMYLTQKGESYTATLMLKNLIQPLDEEKKLNQASILKKLSSHYMRHKWREDGTERPHAEIIHKIIEDYEQQKIKDWVFESATTTGLIIRFFWIAGILLGVIITAWLSSTGKKREKILGSPRYQELKNHINHI